MEWTGQLLARRDPEATSRYSRRAGYNQQQETNRVVVHKFRGNTDEYLNPNNNFINKVLETRRGNPLLVGLVYMLVAQMLGMPVYGVNLPQHFVLAFLEQETYAGNVTGMSTQTAQNRKPLFYINAFNIDSVS